MHTVPTRRAVTRCALMTLASNLLLALAQGVAGTLGASQALLADAFHTLSDALADVAVLATTLFVTPASRASVELLVRRGLGILLIGTAGALLHEALDGLAAPPVTPHPLAIACAGLVMLCKEWMCRYALLVARRVDAPLLVASAWHHRSDALSSALVGVALIAAQAGLPWLDPLAALVVAALIAHAGLRQLREERTVAGAMPSARRAARADATTRA